MEPKAEPAATPQPTVEDAPWLNRNVVGICLASLFADFGHEMATAVLPLFLTSLGASAAALGAIEGVSDGASTLAKLSGGRFADRRGLRHRVASVCYLLTGLATGSFAAARGWIDLLLARTLGWMARGARGPCRDNLLVESVPFARIGVSFGLDRSADSAGAVLGPLVATLCLGRLGLRGIFLLSLLPGLASGAAFFLVVREPKGSQDPRREVSREWRLALPAPFRRFLFAVGVFGVGDFAHSMLVLRAAGLLGLSSARAMSIAVMLYVVHNAAHSLLSYPIGALGDRYPKRRLLAVFYLLNAVASVGFALGPAGVMPLGLLFVLAGAVMAAQETLEKAVATELLPAEARGTGFGIHAATTSVGDMVSSVTAGLLWSRFSPALAFTYTAATSALGALLVLRTL